jgi:hypothetical protein|uniref:Nucelotide kinase n=1 Tax=Siphoviridae sp. ct37J14 TaxID=2826280 RepID=A0A8S5M0Y6_9CAUD|nr:MAG TPA: nucelotide kinase [Siphoviridae sp. ct37J14]
MPVEMPTEMMINALDKCCDGYRKCVDCELKPKYDKEVKEYTDDYGCSFEDMDEQMIKKIYDWYKELDPAARENIEAKCCDKESNTDMVNHPSHYTQGGIECIDALKAVYGYFSDNTKIIINKSNKTIDISIPM